MAESDGVQEVAAEEFRKPLEDELRLNGFCALGSAEHWIRELIHRAVRETVDAEPSDKRKDQAANTIKYMHKTERLLKKLENHLCTEHPLLHSSVSAKMQEHAKQQKSELNARYPKAAKLLAVDNEVALFARTQAQFEAGKKRLLGSIGNMLQHTQREAEATMEGLEQAFGTKIDARLHKGAPAVESEYFVHLILAFMVVFPTREAAAHFNERGINSVDGFAGELIDDGDGHAARLRQAGPSFKAARLWVDHWLQDHDYEKMLGHVSAGNLFKALADQQALENRLARAYKKAFRRLRFRQEAGAGR